MKKEKNKDVRKLKNVLARVFVFLLCLGILSASAEGAVDPAYQYELTNVITGGVAGSQWFATVPNVVPVGQTGGWINGLWGTRGGQVSSVPMYTAADLLGNNPILGHYAIVMPVFVDNAPTPPIPTAVTHNTNYLRFQSAYLVVAEGKGTLNMDFTTPVISATEKDVELKVPGYNIVDNLTNYPSPLRKSFTLTSTQGYGSRLGYLTFKEFNSIHEEPSKVPIVVANVSDRTGPNDILYFDMILWDSAGEPVARKKFPWTVNGSTVSNLGTFYMIYGTSPRYDLTTRITNRTGDRYFRYYESTPTRYDASHWEYDLSPDVYNEEKGLPRTFHLHPNSQIAPGLVTAYETQNVLTDYTYSETFRVFKYDDTSTTPYQLSLQYRTVRGLTPPVTVNSSQTHPMIPPTQTSGVIPWTVSAFNFNPDSPFNETEKRIAEHAGAKIPVMSNPSTIGAAYRHFTNEAFNLNSFSISANVGSVAPDQVAYLPMRVRMRVSRNDISDKWNAVVNAENAGNLAAALPNICTIWFYSTNTDERYADLFTTLKNRGKKVEECVQAFTYDNFLFIDFMMLLADAKSPSTGKTAFCQIVTHDTVNYVYVGDGEKDGVCELGIFVTATVSGIGDVTKKDDSGGGCDVMSLGALAAFLSLSLLLGFTRLNKNR